MNFNGTARAWKPGLLGLAGVALLYTPQWLPTAWADAPVPVAATQKSEQSPPALPANWQQLPLEQLAPVVDKFYLQAHRSIDSAPLREQIALHVWNHYLADEKSFQALNEPDRQRVIDLISLIGRDLPASAVAILAKRLTAFTHNAKAIAAFNFTAMSHLHKALDVLDPLDALDIGPKTTPQMVATWVNSSGQLQSLKQDDLITTAQWLGNDTSAGTVTARKAVAELAWSEFLSVNPSSKAASATTLASLRQAAQLFIGEYYPARQAALRDELVERYRSAGKDLAATSIFDMRLMVVFLWSLKASDQQGADVLSAWVIAQDQRETYAMDDGYPSQLFLTFRELAQGAADPKSFANEVSIQLAKDQVLAGPASAKLMGLLNGMTGDLAAWISELDTKLSRPGLSGDNLALLLLARASAQENLQSKGPLDGMEWGQKALAAATSAKMQLVCTEWVAQRLGAGNESAKALACVKEQLTRTKDPQAIQQLQHLNEDIANYQFAANFVAAQDPSYRLKGQLAFLQSQLEHAQAAHRPDNEVQALQKLVDNTQKQLSPQSPSPTTAPSP